jgi:hypothetical protein
VKKPYVRKNAKWLRVWKHFALSFCVKKHYEQRYHARRCFVKVHHRKKPIASLRKYMSVECLSVPALNLSVK